MYDNPRILLVFGLVFLCMAKCWSQEGDEELQQLDEAEKKKFVLNVVSEELRDAFRTQALLKIDDLERFLGLAEGELKKARVLSKGAVREIADEFFDKISGSVERSIQEVAGTTFSVNGSEYTFEGEEPEKEFLTVRFNFYRTRARWFVRRPRGGSGGSFGSNRLPFKIEDEASWRKSVGSITDEQLSDYSEFVDARANRLLCLAIAAELSHQLRLSAEQKIQMQEYVAQHALRDLEFSLHENVEHCINAQLLDSVPEFLSELQKQKWAEVIK